MLVADIDHFKNVNDTYGHDVGDAVLKEFSVRLKRNTRGIDLACRLGGEEFVIIMPDTDVAHAYQVGERLRACVASDEFRDQRGQKRPRYGERRHRNIGASGRHAGDDIQARRQCALYGQATRTKSRRRGCGLMQLTGDMGSCGSPLRHCRLASH